MMLIHNFYFDWKITISQFFERGTALFRQSFVYLLVVFTVTAIPPTATAGELDELKAMIEQMEARHQQRLYCQLDDARVIYEHCQRY